MQLNTKPSETVRNTSQLRPYQYSVKWRTDGIFILFFYLYVLMKFPYVNENVTVTNSRVSILYVEGHKTREWVKVLISCKLLHNVLFVCLRILQLMQTEMLYKL